MRFIGLWAAAETPNAASFDLVQGEKGYLEVIVYDKSGFEITRKTVNPSDNRL